MCSRVKIKIHKLQTIAEWGQDIHDLRNALQVEWNTPTHTSQRYVNSTWRRILEIIS